MLWRFSFLALSSIFPLALPAHAIEASPSPAAQQAPTPEEPAIEIDPVDVFAKRRPLLARPEREIESTEIDALGAHNIGDAITRLSRAYGLEAPPIVIINGRRVASPQDYLDFPPDALERLEVMPRGSGALYGGGASDRVLNLVLQPRYRGRDGTWSGGRPTNGGQSLLLSGLRQASINNNDTGLIEIRASRDTSLRAAERETEGGAVGPPDTSLRPESNVLSANLSMNRSIGAWAASASINARSQTDRAITSVSDQPVQTNRDLETLTLTGGLGGDVSGWNFQFGMMGTAVEAEQSGVSNTQTRNRNLSANATADGRLLELRTGPITTSLTGRATWTRSEASGDLDERAPETSQIVDLSGALTIPLSRRSGEEADGRDLKSLMGDTVLTVGGSYQSAGGQADGNGLNGALTWSPLARLSVNLSWSNLFSNPTNTQRFDPTFFGAPRKIFDLSRGEVVEVQPLLGGNPRLAPQASEQRSIAVSIGPFTALDFAGSMSLRSNRDSGAIGSLPPLTPAVEAAFPERFTRDANGRLVGVDQRLTNIDRSKDDALSSNLMLGLPARWLFLAGASNDANVRFSVNHTWRLRSRMTLRDDLKELDRLSGDGGGTARHELTAQIDGQVGAFGFNGGLRWRDGYRVRREIDRDTADDLQHSSFRTIDIKLSYSLVRALGQAADATSQRMGTSTRLEFEIANLLDDRPLARLGDGRRAPGYGRDSQDPVGRVVRFSVSARF
ncbi:hypothetical protein [Brevundimonas sp.]|uniref:hypothetical protein n=1 Tax=Brevundimonas sp. TaxID=1871086 RepID=UPI003D6C7D38